jgi:hypothetical protein
MKLIFVYNADSGFISSLKDTAHKLVSPDTYPCNLCRITYPGMTMRDDWREFIKSLPHEVIFLHRDEFHKRYQSQKQVPLPAIFAEDSEGVRVLISKNEINQMKNIDELMRVVKKYLFSPA